MEKVSNNGKSGLIIAMIVLMIVCGVGGFVIGNKTSEKKKDNDVVDKDNKKTEKVKEKDVEVKEVDLYKISKTVFVKEKTTLTIDEYDKETMIFDLCSLNNKNIEEITGTELKAAALKYFNISNLELVDLTCGMEHGNGQTDVMYIYNSKTDKYEYNDDHLGHGGASDGIYYYLATGRTTFDGTYYKYITNVYFLDNGCTGSICGPSGYLDIYLSYDDASKKANKVMNAVADGDYCTSDGENCDEDKIYENIKDKTKTVTFYYTKVNDNYTFNKYEIK